jgi:hypothetical protein
LRNKIWLRVKFFGESQVALAAEFGYKNNVSTHQIAKRVEERSRNDAKVEKKLKQWKALIVNDWPEWN